MTSDTSKNFIIENTLHAFSFLVEAGFSNPIVANNPLNTVICWKQHLIAIELELDWREWDVFVLIVRLENGKPPTGYYVSDGKSCRYHLQKVISMRKWNIDKLILNSFFPDPSKKRPKPSPELLQERITFYKQLLIACLESLIKENDRIFS